MVTLKLACSMDGRIADENGDSKWITGAPARDAVQDLRRAVDGIMIGAETLRSDNPSLLPRPANGRNPWRIVIAGKNPLPVKSKLFNDASRHRTIVFASGKFGQRREMEKRGVSVCEVASSRGHISMKAVLRELAKLDCMHVVCEGGGVLAQALLREKVVDQMWMFYAPILLGDGAVPSVAGRGWKLKNAPGFMMKHVERLGNDVLLVLERD
jgi:diaminohydroxyphosphoribosylaminopyrimidine deaminase/5-amino-6-(5-phosphoribosylamino)uracil reductase